MAIPLKSSAIVSVSPSKQAREEIDTRLSQELVIAMVGPLSSGVSTTSRILRDRLTERFGYDAPAIIKVSGLKSTRMRTGLTGSQAPERRFTSGLCIFKKQVIFSAQNTGLTISQKGPLR